MCVLLMYSILVSVAGVMGSGLVSINAKEVIDDLHAFDSAQCDVILITNSLSCVLARIDCVDDDDGIRIVSNHQVLMLNESFKGYCVTFV